MTLRMNKHIYTKKALAGASRDFSHLVDADIALNGDYYVVKLTSKSSESDIAMIANEFANYVLYLLKG